MNYAKAVIIDKNAPNEVFAKLKSLNITPILSAEIPNIISGVSTHPDMQIHPLEDNLFVCEPTVYNYYKKNLEPYNIKVIKGKKEIEITYPNDIAYNVSKIGKTIVHNTKFTEKTILNYYIKNKFRIINVKQGYSNCSICKVSENKIITDDRGIEKTLKCNGFDVLFTKGAIELSGAENGFIGGCCGFLGTNVIGFCGEIQNYEYGNEIISFLKESDVYIILLCKQKLVDIGSIIPIY